MLDFDGSRKARQRDLAIAAGVLLLALAIWLLPSKYHVPIQSGLRTTVLRPFLNAQATLTSRRVRTLVSGEQEAGAYMVPLRMHDAAGSDLAPGVYFVSLTTGSVKRNLRVVALQ